MKQKAFDKFRHNAEGANERINYGAHMIYMRLKSNLGVKIMARFEMNRVKTLRRGFEIWKIKSQAQGTIQRLQTLL